jgi:outer membrane receptor protein involved in Fe transport
LRYTDSRRHFEGCSRDSGDGFAAAAFTKYLSIIPGAAPGQVVQPGQCVTVNSVTLTPGLEVADLNENNVSWRPGLSWSPEKGELFYVNASRGYKSGTLPILSAGTTAQFRPAKQESVLAYEAGFKLSLLDNMLQLNGAGFYYEYDNKQIRGKLPAGVFGNIGALVNVPRSHIDGFELSAIWRPVRGLILSPALTMVQSRIDRSDSGDFINFNLLGVQGDFTGEALPFTPKWSGNMDAEYNWAINSSLNAYLGGNFSFQSATNSGFGNLYQFRDKAYQLLDLRAGVETADGRWRIGLFGQNVTDTYYWSSVSKYGDTLMRMTGMPATYGVRASFRFR